MSVGGLRVKLRIVLLSHRHEPLPNLASQANSLRRESDRVLRNELGFRCVPEGKAYALLMELLLRNLTATGLVEEALKFRAHR